MYTDDRVAATGVAAAVVTLGAIFLATALSPAFSWWSNALSDLGVTRTQAGTRATVFVFNGGLVLGGLLGVAFAVGLFRRGVDGGDRLVAGLLALTVVLMGLVGVFPSGTALHTPVALAFYLLVSVTLWVDAASAVHHSMSRWALVAGVAGLVNALAWLGWGLTVGAAGGGLALPEILGALALGTWVCARSVTLRGGIRN